MILKLFAYASMALVALNVAESAGFIEKGRYLPFLPRWNISGDAFSNTFGDFEPFKTIKLPGDTGGSGYGFTFHKADNTPTKVETPSMDSAEMPAAHDAIGALVQRIDAEDPVPAAGPQPAGTAPSQNNPR